MLYKAEAPCSWYKPRKDQTEDVEPRLRAGDRAVVNKAVVDAAACVIGQGGETADARALEGPLVQGVRKSEEVYAGGALRRFGLWRNTAP